MNYLNSIVTKVLTFFFLFSCTHDIMEELKEDLAPLSDATMLYQGTFESHNNYTVRGTSKIIEMNGTKFLVFENFSSSSGPDLKVFVSNAISPNNHIDLGDLKALNGNFSYELPTNFELAENGPFVLVYCERFSRLFGSAELIKLDAHD
jgi:hypothetical protein